MLSSFLRLLTPLVILVGLSNAQLPDGRPHANVRPIAMPPLPSSSSSGPILSRNGTVLPPYNTTYYFDQLIDHNNPSLGTFKQRYWHSYEFYEPGGPIILSTPGEGNANGYWKLLNITGFQGLLARQQNGSAIMLEHRFYGLSNPYPDLSTESLKVHTLQQAIDDLVYFANNVHLPMPNGDQLAPGKAPWVLIGGSYSGALTAWTMVNKPGVFHAGYASSAVVEAIVDFWQYWEPIRTRMPANCSADVQAVIAHVDETFTGDNQTAIDYIKDLFGVTALTALDDVAGALRNNLWDWQALQPAGANKTKFYTFCDALEVKDGKSAPESGWGLDHALPAWGTYFKNNYTSILCGDKDVVTCMGTYDRNASFYTNTTIDNNIRSWTWIVCNEVGYYQEGAPAGHPTIASRLIQPPYDLRQCQWMFPEAFPETPTWPQAEGWIAATNEKFQGWDVKFDRIFFANGYRDPWKDATVSADDHLVPSTPQMPIGISDGFHCSDLTTANGLADPTVGAVQKQALRQMAIWLSEWKPTAPSTEGSIKASISSNPPSPGEQSPETSSRSGSIKMVNLAARGPGSAA